jgi:3-deoxy-7-phosphoheptulonate synthase
LFVEATAKNCSYIERIFRMIISIRSSVSSDERGQLMALLCRLTGNQRPVTSARLEEREVIVLDGSQLDASAVLLLRQQAAVEQVIPVKTPYKLVSRIFKPEGTRVVVGDILGGTPVTIGGSAGCAISPVVIAGPCAVENREQLLATAQAVKAAGTLSGKYISQMLRGGAFKPRTSPHQFQGLGVEGLHLLAEAREITGLPVITEVMEAGLVETVAQYADVLQIGSRNMQNFPLLQAAGRANRPVMLKRGFAATIDEWLLAAEYIVAAGNPNVILCERGIRSFDPQTRNVLDLACVPLLHELTHLPVIVDPSHATGRRELVPAMSRAAIAAGADGLLLEVHPDPNNALCDGRQSITAEQLQSIIREMHLMAQIMGEKAGLSWVA